MNAEEWNKFCNVFNLDVEAKVKKQVTRSDILMTLVNEGEFVFKGDDGSWTQMDLNKLKGKTTKEQIKLFENILWYQVVEFIKKQEDKTPPQKERKR